MHFQLTGVLVKSGFIQTIVNQAASAFVMLAVYSVLIDNMYGWPDWVLMILWRHNPLHFYLWGSQHSEFLGDGPISPGEEVAEKTRNPALFYLKTLGGSTLFHCTQLSTRTSSPLSWTAVLSFPLPHCSQFWALLLLIHYEFESDATLSLGLFQGSECNSSNRKFLWQGKEWKEGWLVYSGRWVEYFSPLCRPSEKGQCLHWARLFLMSPQGQLRSSRERENDTRPPTLEGLERRKRGTKFPLSESHLEVSRTWYFKKWLLMASNLEMIKLRNKGQKESYTACLLQGPSHTWERISCRF